MTSSVSKKIILSLMILSIVKAPKAFAQSINDQVNDAITTSEAANEKQINDLRTKLDQAQNRVLGLEIQLYDAQQSQKKETFVAKVALGGVAVSVLSMLASVITVDVAFSKSNLKLGSIATRAGFTSLGATIGSIAIGTADAGMIKLTQDQIKDLLPKLQKARESMTDIQVRLDAIKK